LHGADIDATNPDLAMVRAFVHVVRAAAVLGALVAAHAAVAADRDGDRRTTNTFVLVTGAPAKPADAPRPSSNGVGVAPAKPVVSNPYQVPLLQNAGTLRAR
jgi:hypothetical protein